MCRFRGWGCIEGVLWEIEDEIEGLEERLEKAKRARDSLESLISGPDEEEESESSL